MFVRKERRTAFDQLFPCFRLRYLSLVVQLYKSIAFLFGWVVTNLVSSVGLRDLCYICPAFRKHDYECDKTRIFRRRGKQLLGFAAGSIGYAAVWLLISYTS
jgi:hypothetical protein